MTYNVFGGTLNPAQSNPHIGAYGIIIEQPSLLFSAIFVDCFGFTHYIKLLSFFYCTAC